MARDDVGSLVKVEIDGVSYRCAADGDAKDGKPKYKNEAEQTTGGTFRKITRQSEEVENMTLMVNADELKTLRTVHDKAEDVTLGYTTADGSVYSGKGWISFDGRQTMSGKLEIKMFPRDGWTATVKA